MWETWIRMIEDVANPDPIDAVRIADNMALEFMTERLFRRLGVDGVGL